jgi:hypothetical protein
MGLIQKGAMMSKLSMSMVMGMAQSEVKRRTNQPPVKRLREMRESRRLSQTENAAYNTLWARQNSANSDNGQGAGKEAHTQNLSNGGICLVTQEPLKPLEVIQVKLSFSQFNITIPTIAEVVWASGRSGNGLYRIGLRYLL